MKNFDVEIYNMKTRMWDEITGDYVAAESEYNAIDLVRAEQMCESTTYEERIFYKFAQYRARIADRDEWGSNNHSWIYDEYEED